MIEALKNTTLLVKSVTKYAFFYDFEKKICSPRLYLFDKNAV